MKNIFCFIVLVWFVWSCETKPQKEEKTTTDTISPSNAVIDTVILNNYSDTLTVNDRFIVSDTFRSHISLDFSLIKNKITDTNLVMVVNKPRAILVFPDTSWINEKQRSMDENDWNTIVDDNTYYLSYSCDTLSKIGIPTLNIPDEKKYIKFIKNQQSEYLIDLNNLKDAWGLILFNGYDNPVLWSSTDIDYEIKNIYKK